MNKKILIIAVSILIFLPITSSTVSANQSPEIPETPDGPTEGIVGEEYNYTTVTTDQDNDQIKYGWDWDGDQIVDEWTEFVQNGTEITVTNSWAVRGTYEIRVKAKDTHGSESGWSNLIQIRIAILGDVDNSGSVDNDDVDAFVEALSGESYFYTKYPNGAWFAADCNRDGFVDFIDIDPFNDILNRAANNQPEQPSKPDGATEGEVGEELTFSTSATDPDEHQLYYKWDWGDEGSEWLGPYSSGATVEADHNWDEPGTFEIKVKVKDTYDSESDWSPVLPVTIIDQTPELPQLVISASSTVIEENEFNLYVTANNDPVNNVQITFNNVISSTNEEGRTTFTAPSVDTDTDFTITAIKEGYKSDEFEITVLNQQEEIDKGWFFGIVYSDNLSLLENVQILFTSGSISWSVYTDDQGSYYISIPANTYTIKASLDGYNSILESDKILPPNNAIEQNFILKKIPDYKPRPSRDINEQLLEEKITAEIKKNKVGSKIEVEENYSVVLYNDELNIEIESVTRSEEIVKFKVGADEGTPSQVIVVLIKNQLDEINVEFDGGEINETSDLYTFFSSDNQNTEYIMVSAANSNYVLINIPSFSEHTITISSIVETISIITAVIFYIAVCVIVGIVFSSPKFIRIIRRIYFQKD